MLPKKTIAINSLARLTTDVINWLHDHIQEPLLELIAGNHKIEQMSTEDVESLVRILPPGWHRSETRTALRERRGKYENQRISRNPARPQ